MTDRCASVQVISIALVIKFEATFTPKLPVDQFTKSVEEIYENFLQEASKNAYVCPNPQLQITSNDEFQQFMVQEADTSNKKCTDPWYGAGKADGRTLADRAELAEKYCKKYVRWFECKKNPSSVTQTKIRAEFHARCPEKYKEQNQGRKRRTTGFLEAETMEHSAADTCWLQSSGIKEITDSTEVTNDSVKVKL